MLQEKIAYVPEKQTVFPKRIYIVKEKGNTKIENCSQREQILKEEGKIKNREVLQRMKVLRKNDT